MMVTFISQCEKKALNRTRRVLDAFANRIGERTWQTIITEEGLIAVKKLLRQSVSKNTAVACHWMRSRVRSELVWIVGNRRQFNAEGIVPVNSTLKNHQHSKWENDWTYLPVIKALVAVSALLHDWGKATVLFQKKLKDGSKKSDPLRHEWLSCLLLNALVKLSGQTDQDDNWLNMLINGDFDEQQLVIIINRNSTESQKPLTNLPQMAQLVAWLILTHHRLPCLFDKNERSKWCDQEMSNLQDMLKQITEQWGYQSKSEEADYDNRLKDCFQFQHGLLSNSSPWRKAIKKWASRLKDQQTQVQTLMANGAWRIVLHHARLSLMLGDHYYSSLDADETWQSPIELYANTDKHKFKQKLDEHLVGVNEQALKVSQSLARFTTDMDVANDVKSLKQKSPKGYEWQDIAVDKIKAFKLQNETVLSKGCGWFIVNMASTGCGKTIANAKIMAALSADGNSLRYILALGLRTLTLQTGDEYRNKIKLGADELAVLIGSAAVKELHDKNKAEIKEIDYYEELGSESMEQLLDEELDFEETAPVADFLDAIILKKDPNKSRKNKAFLYKPVLACTIDHIIAATETTRGGKYILPCLRLLSSDLVIDEVDDFDGKDLIAIGRLIHLAGMLGRKVMISSATIPPAVAEGFFNAYQEGWRLHTAFKNTSSPIVCAWVDEFTTQVNQLDKTDSSGLCRQYKDTHQQFIDKRIDKLQRQIIRRKAYIVPCQDIYQDVKNNAESRQERYFEKMQQAAISLHQLHHLIDNDTGKKISFGVIRMANIPPCIKLSKYLIKSPWPENITPKIMAYHSRQVLLLRSQQEKHLDDVLKREKEIDGIPHPLRNSIIRDHIKTTPTENILFILVATPVEEVGRDHDFDWAVIEPSSYRSIIQLGGRVRRHRQSGVDQANIAIMQYNLRALRNDGKPAYYRPGYETASSNKLISHDLCQLLDESALNHAVNAIPRIQQPKTLQPKTRLADLEHNVLAHYLMSYEKKGPQSLQAWLSEYWWLTAVPQQFNRFRESQPEIQLYLVWLDGDPKFYERHYEGSLVKCQNVYGIKNESVEGHNQQHLWLDRSYEKALRQFSQPKEVEQIGGQMEQQMHQNSQRYGELMLPKRENKRFVYSDQFGLLES